MEIIKINQMETVELKSIKILLDSFKQRLTTGKKILDLKERSICTYAERSTKKLYACI